jgi:hypothetical protein
MSGHEQDPVDVLLVEDDPGDALMTRESFVQAGKNNRFQRRRSAGPATVVWFSGGRLRGSGLLR